MLLGGVVTAYCKKRGAFIADALRDPTKPLAGREMVLVPVLRDRLAFDYGLRITNDFNGCAGLLKITLPLEVPPPESQNC
jgi:hypothetical protein